MSVVNVVLEFCKIKSESDNVEGFIRLLLLSVFIAYDKCGSEFDNTENRIPVLYCNAWV
jgi:hypothetical protein